MRIPLFGVNSPTTRGEVVVEASPFYVQRLSRLNLVERRLVMDAVVDMKDRRRWPRNEIYSGDLMLEDENIGIIWVKRLLRGTARPYVVYQFHKPNNCFALIKLVYAGTYALLSDGTEIFDDF